MGDAVVVEASTDFFARLDRLAAVDTLPVLLVKPAAYCLDVHDGLLIIL